MNLSKLNGYYRVTYHADTPAEIFFFTEAFIVICNGRMEGIDLGGCRWEGSFRPETPNTVRGRVRISAHDADPNTVLSDGQGGQHRNSEEYDCHMRVTGDDRNMRLDAAIQHGIIAFEVVVQRVRKLDE